MARGARAGLMPGIACGVETRAAACVFYRDRAQDIAIRQGAHVLRSRLPPVRKN
jgi:hypothetical protein